METIVDILTEDATKLLLDLCRTGKRSSDGLTLVAR
jgi:hypothetical protein